MFKFNKVVLINFKSESKLRVNQDTTLDKVQLWLSLYLPAVSGNSRRKDSICPAKP